MRSTASFFRIFIVLSILLVFIGAGAVYYFALANREYKLDISANEIQNQARLLAEFTNSTLNSVDLTLLAIIETLTTHSGLNADNTKGPPIEQMSRQIQFIAALQDITIIDSDGKPAINASGEQVQLQGYENTESFRRHRDDWLDFHIGMINAPGGPTFGISRRVVDEDGYFKGVVSARLDPDYLQSFFTADELPRVDSVVLVDMKSRILTGWPKSDFAFTDLSAWVVDGLSPIDERTADRLRGGGLKSMAGDKFLISSYQLRNYPIRIMVIQSVSRALGEWKAETRRYITIVALSVFGLIVLLLSVGRLLDKRSDMNRILEIEKEKRRWLDLLREIALAGAKAKNIAESFMIFLKHICSFADWPEAAAWVEQGDQAVILRYTVEDGAPTASDEVLSRLARTKNHWDAYDCYLDYTDGSEKDALIDLNEERYKTAWVIPVQFSERLRVVLIFFSTFSIRRSELPREMVFNLLSLLIRIIEGKQAEEDLASSEAFLRESQKLARIGGWELNLHTGEQVWTAETYKIFEVDDDFDPTPENVRPFFSPEDLTVIRNAMDRAKAAGESYDLDLKLTTGKNREIWVRFQGRVQECDGPRVILSGAIQDITSRKLAEKEREELIAKLQDALSEIKTLKGFIPICSGCKKIRDDEGYWEQIEKYIQDRSDAQFSHSLCPSCIQHLYPELAGQILDRIETDFD